LKLRLAMAAAMAVVFVLSWFSRPLWTSGNENLELWAVTVLENSGDSARLCGEWGKITVRFQGEVPELVTGETYRLYLHRHALCEVEVWSYERIAGPVCNEAGKEQL
jgi:hypothetical protein